MTSTIVELITPAGDSLLLDDPANGLQRTGPVDGIGMPPTAIASTTLFDEPGDWLNNVRLTPRDVHVPLAVVTASGVDDLLAASRRLTAALSPSPLRGFDHLLRFTFGDGTQRELRCRYSAGWDGVLPQYDTPDGVDEWDANVITFHAVDPLFYDVDDTIVTGSPGDAIPFFPMFDNPDDVGPHFATSSVFSEFVVTNRGSWYAWPIWQITGPGSDLIIINKTSGYKIDTTGKGFDLVAGESVTIDTRPGIRSVTKQDGTNWFDKLTDDSWMFPIIVGGQNIDLQLGASATSSAVSLTFKQRYVSL